MARSKITIKHHSKAYKALLQSPEVLGLVEDIADDIATTADIGGGTHRVDSQVGPQRARAAVITDDFEAIRAESESGNLTRSIDAGR